MFVCAYIIVVSIHTKLRKYKPLQADNHEIRTFVQLHLLSLQSEEALHLHTYILRSSSGAIGSFDDLKSLCVFT